MLETETKMRAMVNRRRRSPLRLFLGYEASSRIFFPLVVLSLLLTLSFLLFIVNARENPNVKFTYAVFPATDPSAIVAGDFNGDGIVDVAAGDELLFGRKDGGLTAPVKYYPNANPILARDFNRDGRLDLLLWGSPISVRLLLGKGDGTFEKPIDVSISPNSLIVDDFNKDGRLDLAARDAAGISVVLGNGDGSFRSGSKISLGLTILGTANGDFNHDGNADLIASVGLDQTVRTFLGNGDGTFKTPITSSSKIGLPGTGAHAICVADFDSDGKLDVALADEFLRILKGNGDGTFVPILSTRLRNTSVALKTADFDGDGRPDLVSCGIFLSGALQILLGNGDGTFSDAGNAVPDPNAPSFVIADFNGDMRPDLALKSQTFVFPTPPIGLDIFAPPDPPVVHTFVKTALNITRGDIDRADYFVHQHYVDFLNREPDGTGFNYWLKQFGSCGENLECIAAQRTNVSAAYSSSVEFQRTGYLVERVHKSAYGDAIETAGLNHQIGVPVIRLKDFLCDSHQLSDGVIVGQTGWETTLENNTKNFLAQFVQRPAFRAVFPDLMSPTDFVDRLDANAGDVLSPGERAIVISLFGKTADSSDLTARAQALRRIAENPKLYESEFNKALVLMQYFGYLRRNPNDAPDKDFTGYDFWLNKLNAFNGDYNKAEMVKAFISSSEYRNRFGP